MTDEKVEVLRNLYEKLMRSEEIKRHMEDEAPFYEKVRQFVENPNPTSEEIRVFYNLVVYAEKNGVSSLGRRVLSGWKENARPAPDKLHAIFSGMLLKAREKKEPTSEDYKNWSEQFFQAITESGGEKRQPVMFNRIIAAVFPKLVTPIPSEDRKFSCLYKWMNENGFLGKVEKHLNWFEKNRAIMKVLDHVFENDPNVNEFSKGSFSYQLQQCIENGTDPMVILKDGVTGESAKENDMIPSLVEMLEKSKNVVLTGAPGTGKTYLARQVARAMVLSEEEKKLPEEQIEELIKSRTSFVQFHPSYDYTDFVEGLRPVCVCGDATDIRFERKDGTFKALCRRAVDNAKPGHVDNFEEAWQELLFLVENEERILVPLMSGKGTFPISLNVNKTGLASRTYDEAGNDWIRGQSKFFTKEQIYNVYIGRPGVPSEGHDNYRKAIVKFMREHCHLKDVGEVKGVVAEGCQPYVMIIDEINRGDISKILGELFYAIDKGYRGKDGRVKTQYQNLVGENDPFLDGFYVPENVYIIGTMNDIDRNVESMDFAIRRRFTWKEVTPEERFDAMIDDLKDPSGTIVSKEMVKKHMNDLNAAISDKKNGLGPAYQIGPSYFREIKDYEGDADTRFNVLWMYHLKPLLIEYLRGMPNVDETIKKFETAYNLGEPADSERDQVTEKLAE